MRALLAASLVLVALVATAAAGGTTRSNGLVSFGVCCSPTGIYVIRPNGSGQKRIYSPPFDDASLASAWSPQGTRLAFVAPGGLWTMSPTGTNRKRLTKGMGDTLAPSWAPDGKRIVFVDLAARHSRNYAVYVIGNDGRGLKRITRGAKYENNPAWSPSGRVIAFERGSSLWTATPSGTHQKRIGTGTSPSWAPDGHSLAFDRNGDLWTMKANGTAARLVAEVPSATAGIAWSPDGQWIAYAKGDRGDVMLVHPDGSGSRPLTHDAALFHSTPAWQPRP